MSGHWRFCVAASFFLAGLTTLPASSNPLTDLFNPAPKEAAAPEPAPAPAREACASQPGRSTASGQHWFYRLDGHHKCWYQAAEATHSVHKPVRHEAATRPVVAPDENEVAVRKRTVMDAHDQLLGAATADAPQATTPAPEAVDQASVSVNEAAPSAAATPEPVAPVAAQPAVDQLAADHAPPRPVDVDMLLADSSLDKGPVVSSVPPATPNASSIPKTDQDHSGSTATWAGMALIALGLVFLAGSLLARRFRDPIVTSVRRA